MSTDRRTFMRDAAAMTALGAAVLRDDALQRIEAAVVGAGGASADELASNEDFWFNVQNAYDVDRSVINLNNGGVAPSPRVVMDAMHRHDRFTNQLPSRHLWDVLDPQVETVRVALAKSFGCDPEELAIVRNASEALETCLLGIDLKPGDEILTTTLDYPRMLTTLRQREAREGIVIKKFSIPAPPKDMNEITKLFEQNITPKTKVILLCHIINITGQVLDVKSIARMGRERGIEVIVDGAHAFAHFPFQRDDIDCDYYGTSLHKWLSAPIGTGFLYVRREKIKSLWSLMASEEKNWDNIRKYEEIGTHPTAPRLAIAEALRFFEGLGADRKAARLRYLRDRWAKRLVGQKKFKFFTNLDPSQSCAIATVGIEGIPAADLTSHLFAKHKILTTPIVIEQIDGIRVTPNTYTTIHEVDAFADAMEQVASRGLSKK